MNRQLNTTKQQYAPPSPRVFNVGSGVLELALRNLVPSHSIPSRLLRHANIERRGYGGCTKTTCYIHYINVRVANFCPSTVLVTQVLHWMLACTPHVKHIHIVVAMAKQI